MTTKSRTYPDISYVETDTETIVNTLIQGYEKIAGRTLYPADPARLFILWVADIEVKRRTIRDSIQVHRRLGTKYAVEKALGAVYPGTKVEEWFEYGGDPYKFRVVIGATEAGITADRQAAVLDRVRFYKNLRSHLEAISYQIEKRTAVKVAAVHAIGQRVEVYPYLARNMESHGGFYCGGYTQYGRKLAVFPNK